MPTLSLRLPARRRWRVAGAAPCRRSATRTPVAAEQRARVEERERAAHAVALGMRHAGERAPGARARLDGLDESGRGQVRGRSRPWIELARVRAERGLPPFPY